MHLARTKIPTFASRTWGTRKTLFEFEPAVPKFVLVQKKMGAPERAHEDESDTYSWKPKLALIPATSTKSPSFNSFCPAISWPLIFTLILASEAAMKYLLSGLLMSAAL